MINRGDNVCFYTRSGAFAFAKVCYIRGNKATIIGYNNAVSCMPVNNLMLFRLDNCPKDFTEERFKEATENLNKLDINIDLINGFSMRNLREALEKACKSCGVRVRSTALHTLANLAIEDHRRGVLVNKNLKIKKS